MGNDRISSLFVPPGFTVKVCQHENGGGACFTYTGPRMVNLPEPLNNHVSYVQVSRPGLTTVRPLVVRWGEQGLTTTAGRPQRTGDAPVGTALLDFRPPRLQ